MTPAEKYRALLNSQGPAPDMAQGLTDATRAQMFALFTPGVAADMWDRWVAEHVGNSLVAQLDDDGTIGSVVEMPSAQADILADSAPDRILIIATWPGVS